MDLIDSWSELYNKHLFYSLYMSYERRYRDAKSEMSKLYVRYVIASKSHFLFIFSMVDGTHILFLFINLFIYSFISTALYVDISHCIVILILKLLLKVYKNIKQASWSLYVWTSLYSCRYQIRDFSVAKLVTVWIYMQWRSHFKRIVLYFYICFTNLKLLLSYS